jgi:HEAT repeat protein
VLEWGLVTERSGSRRRAVALAGHTGDVATAAAALDDPDADVRSTAIGALARAGALTPTILERGLRDDAAAVRRRAVEEIARCAPTVRAELRLVPLLEDPDPLVAEATAFALGELDPPESGAAAALARIATGSDDVLLREAAVAALGSLGDPEGRTAVLAATGDVSTVRRRAVLALAAFDGPDVEAALARLAEDRDRQVRQWAEDLLRGWG